MTQETAENLKTQEAQGTAMVSPTGEGTEDPPNSEEQQKLEAADAEAGFTAGFKKARGEETAPDETPPATDPEPDAGKIESKPVETEPDEKQKLNDRLRRIEGHIGGLKSQVISLASARDAANEAAEATRQEGSPAPNRAQVRAAFLDSEKFKKLKAEFPDWADALEEGLLTVSQSQSPAPAAIVQPDPVDTQAIVNQARELARIDIKHENWEGTVKSDDFLAFANRDGPTQDERAALTSWQHASLNPSLSEDDRQTAMLNADALLHECIRRYPNWWSERGNLMFSNRPEDAIKLLDAYEADRQEKAKQESKRQRDQNRLKTALTPAGSGGEPDRGISDNEAFKRGFKRAVGR